LKTAAALYGKGLQIAKTLHDEVLPKLSFAEQVRRGPEIEGGYAVSLEKFGDLRMKEGSNKQAATFYGMSYDGYRSLVGKQPDDPRWETRATKVAEKATKAGGDPGREAALRARLIGDEPTSLAEEKAKGQAVVNEMRQFGVGDRVRHVTARLTGTVKSVGGGVILVDLDPTPDRPRGTVGQYDHFWFSEHPNTLVKVPGAPGIDVAERTGAVDSGGGPQPFRTDMKANHPDEQTITLEGENGEAYTCRILGVFELDGREYALLLKLGNQASVGDDKEDDSTVIMRLVQQGDQAIFRTIENDEEFERVVAYVKALADEKSE
jgi:uncharacterized protein YrzB (UPF0473 family)